MSTQNTAFNSLSRDHRVTEVSSDVKTTCCTSFNSLSRDHMERLLEPGGSAARELSTPSLGITGPRARGGIYACRLTFQLPLSGSLDVFRVGYPAPDLFLSTPSLGITGHFPRQVLVLILETGLRILSTPSLGITSGTRHLRGYGHSTHFQLPLSGSQEELVEPEEERSREVFQLPLSGSLDVAGGAAGTSAVAFQLPLSGSQHQHRWSSSQCRLPSFQLPLSGSREMAPVQPYTDHDSPFNSLSRDHWLNERGHRARQA